MKFKTIHSTFSRKDIEKGLFLPNEMTSELAEDIGIMVGDGCLYYRKSHFDYEISVVGNLFTDRSYLFDYVRNLKILLFNLEFKFAKRPSITTCVLRTSSKGLFNFYSRIICLPIGSKGLSGIPHVIMNSDRRIKKGFLRGLSDTDMTLIFKKTDKNVLHYPIIKIQTASKILISDLKELLEELGFKPAICLDMKIYHKKMKRSYTSHELKLSGRKNLIRWVEEIGFRNPKNILRFQLWKKNGHSLPNESIEKKLNGPTGIRIPE